MNYKGIPCSQLINRLFQAPFDISFRTDGIQNEDGDLNSGDFCGIRQLLGRGEGKRLAKKCSWKGRQFTESNKFQA